MSIAIMATCLAVVSMISVLSEKSVGFGLVLISSTYGGMMFASSYVEEEQHFWYLLASSWGVYLFIKE